VLAAPTLVQPHQAFRFADPSVIGTPRRQAVVTVNDSQSELARYLEEDLLERNQDPLEYWCINGAPIPNTCTDGTDICTLQFPVRFCLTLLLLVFRLIGPN